MIRFLLCLCGLGLSALPAFAHKMIVTVSVTDLAVNVTAAYEDGEFVPAGAKVTILDAGKGERSEGVTDETGECRLPRPEPGVYTVAVDDKQGHYGEVVIEVRAGESTSFQTSVRNRWIMAGLGLGVIGFGTVVAMRWKKSAVNPSP